MTKLHELLAASGNLESQATKVRADLANTFEKKRHLFEETSTVFTPNGEGAQSQVEAQSALQTTVRKELAWVQNHLAKALDADYQICEANMKARADVVLDDDGTKLLSGIPATSLLELEKRMVEVQQLASAIPTLDPAKGYEPDAQRGAGIYKAREVTKTRTKKVQKPVVLYEATKEHPAQVQLANEDVPVGTIFEKAWSSMLTPAEKSEIMDRADQVIRAVKRARSRANDVEVDTNAKLGLTLLRYIFDGRKPQA